MKRLFRIASVLVLVVPLGLAVSLPPVAGAKAPACAKKTKGLRTGNGVCVLRGGRYVATAELVRIVGDQNAWSMEVPVGWTVMRPQGSSVAVYNPKDNTEFLSVLPPARSAVGSLDVWSAQIAQTALLAFGASPTRTEDTTRDGFPVRTVWFEKSGSPVRTVFRLYLRPTLLSEGLVVPVGSKDETTEAALLALADHMQITAP